MLNTGVHMKWKKGKHKWWDDNLCCNVNGYICILMMKVCLKVFVGDPVCVWRRVCVSSHVWVQECVHICVYWHALCQNLLCTQMYYVQKLYQNMKLKYMLVN